MLLTLIRIAWLNLKRDRVAQALTFLLPIIFFSIFASVLGNQRDTASRVRLAVVDEDRSDYSQKLVAALRQEGGLRVRTHAAADGTGPELTRAAADTLVKNGGVQVAVVLPKGLGQGRRFWADQASLQPIVELLADVSDPIAPQVVQGLLQKVAFTAAPELMAAEGLSMFEKYGGPLTDVQRKAFDQWLSNLKQRVRRSGGVEYGGRAQDRDCERHATGRRAEYDRLVLRRGDRRDVSPLLVRRCRRDITRGGRERHTRPVDRLTRRHGRHSVR
jgi:ABC-2 type transport system permease protein